MITNKVYLDNKLSFIDTIEYPSKSMYRCELTISLYPHCIQLPAVLAGLSNAEFSTGTIYVIHTFKRWMKRTLVLMIKIRADQYILFQGETPTIDYEIDFSSPFYLYPIFFDPARNDFYLLNVNEIISPFRFPTSRPDHLLETCKLNNIYELMRDYNLMPVEAAMLYTPTKEFVLTKIENRRSQLRKCLKKSIQWDTNYYEQLIWYKYHD